MDLSCSPFGNQINKKDKGAFIYNVTIAKITKLLFNTQANTQG